MVYNAMKLFMEINPALFDDCSHEYTEMQNSAAGREQNRKEKWDRLDALASKMKSGLGPPPTTIKAPAETHNDIDPLTQDSQKRLDALKLQDESATRDRRRDGEKGNAVSP